MYRIVHVSVMESLVWGGGGGGGGISVVMLKTKTRTHSSVQGLWLGSNFTLASVGPCLIGIRNPTSIADRGWTMG